MQQENDPPIVGIGASAGGVQALQTFFETIPADTGAAFVVILHLDPAARSHLAAILGGRTAMPVQEVDESMRLLGDHVYVIAPDRQLRVADQMIATEPFDEPRGQRAPIDLFFRSLAAQHHDGFAVVLTGAGDDGATGVKAIKEAGGIVLVQDPHEAEYASMPHHAIATEAADFVLPVRALAGRLAELLSRHKLPAPDDSRLDENETLRRILAHVRVRTGHDFSQYKRATVLRRIARRVQVSRKDSLAEYYSYLRENPEEAQTLFSDFLISVTTFFRDRKAFERLKQLVIPQLFDGREADGGGIRVWVPGCATGEEAYSLGMLLLEEAGRRDVRQEIQLFASDVDTGALAIAREGRYPITIEADLGEERLRRFFVKEGEHYLVRRELRDIVLFANHSMLKDPPFSRLDMISCRNLLIYLDRELQQQVCATFHYALNAGGFLFLGTSESAEQPPGLFRLIDRDARIYRAAATARGRSGTHAILPVLMGAHPVAERLTPPARVPAPSASVSDAALHRQMLEKVAPPSMLVNDSHRALHLSENAGRYLQPSGGPVSVDAADMVRPELRFDLRSALHRAFERGEPTMSLPIPVQFNDHPHNVYLNVRPVPSDDGAARHALVMFIEGDIVEHTEQTALSGSEPAQQTIHHLQEELERAQARLRTMREDSETANEELRAANEELQSINEEYRSTSEELETSKEELQSINEELQTVNNELKLKLEGVSRAHSDLQNLMAATDVGTLFLDPSLRIKRFTPSLTGLFNVTMSDEGRPITDFTHRLQYTSLAEDARNVLRDLSPVEHEVQDSAGGWFLVRMRPYRTIEDKIDGIVVTFVDITARRAAEAALRESEERLRQEMRLVELSRAPIFVWDFDGGIVQWNRGSEALYGYTRQEAMGRDKVELLHAQIPELSEEAFRAALLRQGNFSGEVRHTTKDGRVLVVESQAELATFGGRRLVLESTWDVTGKKLWEQHQKLLLDELTHRVKNTLAVVQSIARQTLRRAASPEVALANFEGRLQALAKAHRLLVETQWEGVELSALVQSQMQAHLAGDVQRLRMTGAPVVLPAGMAAQFGLLLYELATNAAKYGALSDPKGYVTLRWETDAKNGTQQLHLDWQEHDGPHVEPPSSNGFGSVLIERSLPQAKVRQEFLPEGLHCTIDVAIPAHAPSIDGHETARREVGEN